MLYDGGWSKRRISKFCITFERQVINIKHQFFRYTTMMNQEDIFKKIGQILNELNDQYQYLAQNSQDFNELELELFLANADFLSDHVQILRKLNNGNVQKALPEHTQQEEVVLQPAPLPVIEFHEPEPEPEVLHLKPLLEEDIFKPDSEPSPFEFILNEKTSDKFEFEEKSVDEIFDRPLSKEEALIIAQKQKLREKDSLQIGLPEEDEIGPEPFLVAESSIPLVTEEEKIVAAEPEIIQQETPELTPSYRSFKDEAASTADFLERNDANDSVENNVEEQEKPEERPVQEWVQQEPVKVIPPTEPVKQEEIISPAQPAAKLTLNEILSGNNKPKNYYSENSRANIQDLKQAISLNDKMRYIKDLFNGYNLAYAEAIDLLNKMPDFKSADYFLQKNYAVKNNWADKQETADQFYELLHLRFPA